MGRIRIFGHRWRPDRPEMGRRPSAPARGSATWTSTSGFRPNVVAYDIARLEEWATWTTRTTPVTAHDLSRMAGRHRKRLRKAEIASRRSGHYLDSAVATRAQRLLLAAVTGEVVTEEVVTDPSPSDRHRFEVVAAFRALPPDRAW